MSKNKLEVYTLGKFIVKKGNNIINEKHQRSHKLWHLFKILISFPNRVFTAEELMDRLDLSLELNDAKNAIQNLVFRLRKILAAGEKYEAEKYIIYEEFGYGFNWNTDHYIDFINFEKCCQMSEETLKNNGEDDLPFCALEALKIYRGDFLHENKDVNWINQKRLYLRRLYLEEIYLISALLKKKEDFAKVEEISERALNVEPFDEEIHFNLLNALIRQNKKQKAKLHYQYMLNVFSLNKLKLNSHLENLLAEVVSAEEQREEINKIKAELENFAQEADFCFVDKSTFNYFCWFSIRKKERNKTKSFLISISLNINLEKIRDDEYQEIINYLEEILKQTIRNIDIVCRWNKIQYLILFNELDFFEIQEIISRFRKAFYSKDIPQEIIINLDSIQL